MLSQLDAADDLGRAAKVCKHWRGAAYEEELWKAHGKGIPLLAKLKAESVVSEEVFASLQSDVADVCWFMGLELEGQEFEQETKKQKVSLLQRSTELEQRLHETPGENRQERAPSLTLAVPAKDFLPSSKYPYFGASGARNTY